MAPRPPVPSWVVGKWARERPSAPKSWQPWTGPRQGRQPVSTEKLTSPAEDGRLESCNKAWEASVLRLSPTRPGSVNEPGHLAEAVQVQSGHAQFNQASALVTPRQGNLELRDLSWAFLRSTWALWR